MSCRPLASLTWKAHLWKLKIIHAMTTRHQPEGFRVPHFQELKEVQQRARRRTDINDHLVTLFLEALTVDAKLIVELGVRGGETTFVLERVARLSNAMLVSVDLNDCSSISSYPKWRFVQGDDVAFGGAFAPWCQGQQIEPKIDLLLIDTSHVFDHTTQEIAHWFPWLSGRAKVVLRDRNLQEVYFRRDGSVGIAWDNQRAVIKALEHYFTATFDETEDFIDLRQGWLIKHYAVCNGFTILAKVGECNNRDVSFLHAT